MGTALLIKFVSDVSDVSDLFSMGGMKIKLYPI